MSGHRRKHMNLEKAVDLGEYKPEYLATFPEWTEMSPHAQLQYIKRGLVERRKQLLGQWAEMDRAIDARLKPNLETAKKNIEKQLKKLESAREYYYVEYSSKF